MAVLFLDTEGIGAAGATAEHDARVFSLATLICSLLIYNSVGAIDEDAIQVSTQDDTATITIWHDTRLTRRTYRLSLTLRNTYNFGQALAPSK
jgi:hypothetical protein